MVSPRHSGKYIQSLYPLLFNSNMPRTQRQKSRVGTFAVSPWVGKEDYNAGVLDQKPEDCHRVVECPSLIVGSVESCDIPTEERVQDELYDCLAGERAEVSPPCLPDVQSQPVYLCPPDVHDVQCIISFRVDGSLSGMMGGGHEIGISGHVFQDISSIDCTMDQASYAVLLCLYSTKDIDIRPVWVVAESSGGDAMCLKSPMVGLSHENILGPLRLDGMVRLELDFQCDMIIDCEEGHSIESQVSNAIHDKELLTWARDEITPSSHINIGTLCLSRGTTV